MNTAFSGHTAPGWLVFPLSHEAAPARVNTNHFAGVNFSSTSRFIPAGFSSKLPYADFVAGMSGISLCSPTKRNAAGLGGNDHFQHFVSPIHLVLPAFSSASFIDAVPLPLPSVCKNQLYFHHISNHTNGNNSLMHSKRRLTCALMPVFKKDNHNITRKRNMDTNFLIKTNV